MGRIAVLSEELINKIAAGEVVERPASVIKELCENSLDAGARNVRVSLSGSGLSAITVSDDGCGMSRQDAELSLSRHATSKLRDLEGLFQIATLGFRGEALPAIASVSRFNLTTSEPGAAAGTRLGCEGGGAVSVEEAPAVGGTRIEVAELFFNTPARRKFMRRDQTELSHCHEAVVRLALANPEVGFFLEHEGRALLTSPPSAGDLRERIAAALGPEVHAHLLPVDERRLGVRVWGFVASPELSFPTARGLYTFVNRRFIRDRAVNHAVARAFRDTLPPGRQPVAVLFIEVDPRAVDVNVHPQKLEVRFADGRGVHDAVASAIEHALKGSASLDPQPGSSAAEAVPGAHYAQAVERFLARAQAPIAFEAPQPSWGKPGFGTARPGLNEAPPPGYFAALRPLGPLAGRYLVCEGAGGSLVVIDPHAAAERARLDELRRALEADGPATQPSLFSATVELESGAAAAIAAHASSLERLGILVEPFGGTTLAVRALPAALTGVDLRALFAELAGALPRDCAAAAGPGASVRRDCAAAVAGASVPRDFAAAADAAESGAPGPSDGALSAGPRAAGPAVAAAGSRASGPSDAAGARAVATQLAPALRVLACHAAGTSGRELSAAEAAALFAALDRADFRLPCTHAAVVIAELPLLELERRAGGAHRPEN